LATFLAFFGVFEKKWGFFNKAHFKGRAGINWAERGLTGQSGD